jgi:hypothetical protein
MYTHQAIHSTAILHYIWSEQKCIRGNIMKNSTVYCQMGVCSCFVVVLKIYII